MHFTAVIMVTCILTAVQQANTHRCSPFDNIGILFQGELSERHCAFSQNVSSGRCTVLRSIHLVVLTLYESAPSTYIASLIIMLVQLHS